MRSAIITRHAMKRCRGRLGVPKKAVQSLADAALVEGTARQDVTGHARRYMDQAYLSHRVADNIRAYRGSLFLFRGDTLITAWPLPANVHRRIDAQKPERNSWS